MFTTSTASDFLEASHKPPLSSVVSFHHAAHKAGYEPDVKQARTLPRCHRVSPTRIPFCGDTLRKTKEVDTFFCGLTFCRPSRTVRTSALILLLSCFWHFSLIEIYFVWDIVLRSKWV
jgi:hypothetical protein